MEISSPSLGLDGAAICSPVILKEKFITSPHVELREYVFPKANDIYPVEEKIEHGITSNFIEKLNC